MLLLCSAVKAVEPLLGELAVTRGSKPAGSKARCRGWVELEGVFEKLDGGVNVTVVEVHFGQAAHALHGWWGLAHHGPGA
jgi:hypothetical protein